VARAFATATRRQTHWDLAITTERRPARRLAMDGAGRAAVGRYQGYVPVASAGVIDDDLLDEARSRVEHALADDGFRDARGAITRDTSSRAS